MNAAGLEERLPPSPGGLLDLALAAYAERAWLYLLLALVIFAVYAIIEFVVPAGKDDATRIAAYTIAPLFTDSLLISAVALGVGTRVAAKSASTRQVMSAALERWLPVMGALTIANFFVEVTLPYGGLGVERDPVVLFTAPLMWLLWGAMWLAGPVAALNGDRPTIAIVTGFGRALFLSLLPANLGRLCLIAFASIVPLLLQQMIFDLLHQRGVAHAAFYSTPVDALFTGPLAALQTAFALDFARRAAPPVR